ncbi:hypothetical protein [Chitinophaga sancti]|uniref:Uncharacterized protein n=1 Tax=Chitinophaga sancti TaxID=1004 RepID=A0A1K1PR10_9BACT|nr:hypothetical protein [Chitinophaga sancti]WQD61749.1 hypothetical protein U0033_28105 [Chitinophaga sancti]WQG92693.1 hypothetical protein SR876_14335 [Chitinophaga sancti]SFW49969.1 hypothetical protein SAMN05661012_02116 [Chitinophaga sancti]
MENEQSQRNSSLTELGLLLPILYISIISIVYYFELGYFSLFDIPIELIKVELDNRAYLLFGILVILAILFQNIIPAAFLKPKKKIPNWCFIIVGIIPLLFWFYFDFKAALRLIPLLFSLYLILPLNLYHSDAGVRRLFNRLIFINNYFKISTTWIAATIKILVLTCVLSFGIGYSLAFYNRYDMSDEYLDKHLIRNYENYSIYIQKVFVKDHFERKIYVADSKVDTISIK